MHIGNYHVIQFLRKAFVSVHSYPLCSDRIAPFWALIHGYLRSVLVSAERCTWAVERAAVGLMRLAIRLLRRDEVSALVFRSLSLLLLLHPRVLLSLSAQLLNGLQELVQTNATILAQWNAQWNVACWQMLLAIIQTAAGGRILHPTCIERLRTHFAPDEPPLPTHISSHPRSPLHHVHFSFLIFLTFHISYISHFSFLIVQRHHISHIPTPPVPFSRLF